MRGENCTKTTISVSKKGGGHAECVARYTTCVMKAVPFQVDLGLQTVQGILRLEKNQLAIQWRVFDLLGAPTGDLKGIEVPYNHLDKIDCRKRLGGAKLEIVARSPTSFGEFPLPEGSITTLPASIKRRNKADAELWAAEATLRIAESEDRELLEE